jgi:hypothetical protein
MGWSLVGRVFYGFPVSIEQKRVIESIWGENAGLVQVWELCNRQHYAIFSTIIHTYASLSRDRDLDPFTYGFVKEIDVQDLMDIDGTYYTTMGVEAAASFEQDPLKYLEKNMELDIDSFWDRISNKKKRYFEEKPQIRLFNALFISI